MDGNTIRAALLGEVSKRARSHQLQPASVLNEVARQLSIPDSGPQAEALLTFWSDLFRSGHIAWGYDLSNIDPPFFHVTDRGRRVLETFSRDPVNPGGYRAYLKKRATLNDVAESYLNEALDTFNAGSFKAAAVMIGAAAESLVLELRDALVAKMSSLQLGVPSKLQSWQIKTVLGAIQDVLTQRRKEIPPKLFEALESYWPAFTQQIRTVRNEAGHPTSVDPISEEVVHASLLIFPELAGLAASLRAWVSSSLS